MNWENIAKNLQQQIGQLAANHAGEIALLHEQYQQHIGELQAKLAEHETPPTAPDTDETLEAPAEEPTEETS